VIDQVLLAGRLPLVRVRVGRGGPTGVAIGGAQDVGQGEVEAVGIRGLGEAGLDPVDAAAQGLGGWLVKVSQPIKLP